MGYRSEVVLAVKPQLAPAFMALTAKHPEVLELCNDADRFTSGYESEGDWFMHWRNVKWYNSFTEIEIVNKFIHALEMEDLTEYGVPDPPVDEKGKEMDWSECFRFIKIGEEMDDVQYAGSGFWNIGVSRHIDF